MVASASPPQLTLQDLHFERPDALQAARPAELRGAARDDVRLLVSSADRQQHAHFTDLADYLGPGDLLVVNDSATLPASLRATTTWGDFVLNLSTRYSSRLWLAEPRVSQAEPGKLSPQAGDSFDVAGLAAKFVAPHPTLPRLWFVQFKGDIQAHLFRWGQPIRYGYVPESYDLSVYQTIFARLPGSAEMASAARPFSKRVLASLHEKGVQLATLTLHTGVSSLELDEEGLEHSSLYAEPFKVPLDTAEKINKTKATHGRVIAVGTTVVRALESVWDETTDTVKPAQGFTKRFIKPASCHCFLDGLLSGFHDPKASHLAMLYALAGQRLIRQSYAEAVHKRYLWHEFGDSHLILFAQRLP